PLGPRSFLIGEAAFPHIVCSFVMKQTLHQTEGRSGGQVNAISARSARICPFPGKSVAIDQVSWRRPE
ncbi:MAG: hypothetical protein ACK4IA_09900, partial [Paracoccus hibiscisoli]|uniref:hypothetical protein n=1 Tax=Paracoccus hibiscisoli TaxID=2023261 RepID=UPI00391A41F9